MLTTSFHRQLYKVLPSPYQQHPANIQQHTQTVPIIKQYHTAPDYSKMNNLGTHNNHASWTEQQLYASAPRRLAGTDLVRVAEHYTNEELLVQVNKYREKDVTLNAFTKSLSEACLQYALGIGQEPDVYRDSFNAERLRNFTTRNNASQDIPDAVLNDLRSRRSIMPAHICKSCYKSPICLPTSSG